MRINPRAVSPEGTKSIGEISPDGKTIAALAPDNRLTLYAVDGGESRSAGGAEAGDVPIRWSADGNSIFVYRHGELPAKVHRLNIQTGRKELWKELMPADPTGIDRLPRIVITPDEKSYAYSYYRNLSQLYLVEGLK